MYPALILAAMLCAWLAPKDERLAATQVCLFLAANWLLCETTYFDNPPQKVLHVSAVTLWCVFDVCVGFAALAISGRWWAWAIWAASVCQVGFHIVHGALPDSIYTYCLDWLLHAQLACFYFLGGRGVGNRISPWLCSVPGFRRLVGSANRVLAKVNPS